MSQEFALLETSFVPAAVRVTDQKSRIRDQDQALGVAENLAGKIALSVQFRLVSVQAGDIEHQAANLQQLSRIVVHAEGVNQNVNRRAVLAPKRGFKVPHLPVLFQGLA